jgi:hypothetical protein
MNKIQFYFYNFKGTSNLITQLGLTDKKHKASLNYLQSIKNHEKMKYSIDFNTLIQTSK